MLVVARNTLVCACIVWACHAMLEARVAGVKPDNKAEERVRSRPTTTASVAHEGVRAQQPDTPPSGSDIGEHHVSANIGALAGIREMFEFATNTGTWKCDNAPAPGAAPRMAPTKTPACPPQSAGAFEVVNTYQGESVHNGGCYSDGVYGFAGWSECGATL